ncbi:MAG: S8 family serine peptidase [Candidatus Omnitrophica bacterium]|nr:S8 family serine peptidase [Candidatus Omnitrophota bacterium]
MKNRYTYNVGICAIVLLAAYAHAQTPTQNKQPIQDQKKLSTPYIPGRVIIKFKSQGPQKVRHNLAELLDQEQLNTPVDASSTQERLKGLMRRHQVSRARQMFMRYHEKDLFRQKISARLQRREQRLNNHPTATEDVDQIVNQFSDVYALDVPDDSDIERLCADMAQDPAVEYAHPDYRAKIHFIPNDSFYAQLWGTDIIQATGNGQTSLDLEQGTDIIVAVVDTGLLYTHPDITGRMWTNTQETAGNGIDDDGNGYVDDVNGWDFTTCASWGEILCDEPKPPDNDPLDGNGHGTHVSGTIAAIGNNSMGIIGVAPQAKIMPLKALNDEGDGTFSELAEAILYALNNGAQVINNSWGCTSPCSSVPTTENAVQAAYLMGVTVVFSAGNANDDVANYSPQNMDETIAVAAFDADDNRAGFSNYGPLIDVAAPGVAVVSLHLNNSYAYLQGTSMAAPHVSALVALIKSYHSDLNLTYELIRKIARMTADDVDAPGFDQNSGWGRINALEALTLDRLKPTLNQINDQTVDINELLTFVVQADDPDHTPGELTLSATLTNGNPLATIGAAFTDNSDGTGTFSWTPVESQGDINFYLIFKAEDPDGLIASQAMQIAVLGSNQAPLLDALTDRTVIEQSLLTVSISGSDPNHDPLVITATVNGGNPLATIGAALTDNSDGTALIEWIPALGQGGRDYTFTIRVEDDSQAFDTASFTVTVQTEIFSFPLVQEAETMPVKTIGVEIPDGWNLFSDGYVEKSFLFPTGVIYEIIVIAKGEYFNATLPVLDVRVDQQSVWQVEVNSTDWGVYVGRIPISAGQHDIALAFTNDGFNPPDQDRNLLLNRIILVPTNEFFTSIEAEDMSTRTCGAATPRGWNLYSNGYIEETVDLPAGAIYEVDIIAKGEYFDATLPDMEVRVDQIPLDNINVDATDWATYTLNIPLSAGQHQIALAFTNDGFSPPDLDRNLMIDKVSLKWTRAFFVGIEAEDMFTKTVGGATPGGWNLWSNGYIEDGMVFPVDANYKIRIIAKGDFFDATLPNMQVLIDRIPQTDISVDTTDWGIYEVTIPVTAGTRSLGIGFNNDAFNPPDQDRNLYVDKVYVTAGQ